VSIDRLEAEQLAWLRRLRWVSPLECILTGVCCVGVLALFVLGITTGHPGEALLVCGSHVLVLVAVLVVAPRRTSSQWLALVALSLLNYGVALLNAFPGWQFIAWSYAVVGIVSAGWAVSGCPRLRVRWREVSGYRERSDFKWLLTEAPLALRFHFARLVAGPQVTDSSGK
jgi:hypothetical protein